MSEKEREEIYWKLFLFLIILSPFILVGFFRNNMEFSINMALYIGSMAASIPLVFLIDIILHIFKGEFIKFNVVNPKIKDRNKVKETMEKCTEDIIKRLNELGFYIKTEGYEITDNIISCLKENFHNDERFDLLRAMRKIWIKREELSDELIELDFGEKEIVEILNYIAINSSEEGTGFWISKEQAPQPHSYLDMAFSGIVALKRDSFGIIIEVEVTMLDTIILDSGESEFLKVLCDYISLKNPDYNFKNVPLTLYCGASLALLSGFLGFFFPWCPQLNSLIFSFSVGGAAMILFMLLFVMGFRRDLLGFRLIPSGLYITALPYIYLLIKYMTNLQVN